MRGYLLGNANDQRAVGSILAGPGGLLLEEDNTLADEDGLWLLSSRVAICSWGAFTAGDRKVGSDCHPERTPIARASRAGFFTPSSWCRI